MYARRHGVSLERAVNQTSAAVAVDAGALKETEDKIRSSWLSMARSALTAAGIDPLIVDRAMEAPEEAPTKTASVPTGRLMLLHVAFTAVDQWQRVDT